MANEVHVKKELQLIFTDKENKETLFKISVPKENVSLAECRAVGEAMLNKQFIMSSKGDVLVDFKGAQMAVSTITPLS
ncbi:DUF2922 domain-containing protein [uncultured Veillonella sp.]|uniref:DUF2922 domain-containing protein n=1 Tax=uncultured Veillonella sp. TaxID=159268 RepID=UPI002631582B|nr:DUF2922 domain-containing protein [uncultured Veillonella sp.]